MSGRLALCIAIALSACASVARAGTHALPADVTAFVERRDACDHFRGEDAYDSARAAELKMKLAGNCAGTDKKLAALRRKYAGNRRVMKRLSRYEAHIE
jgi:hypothetical protein